VKIEPSSSPPVALLHAEQIVKSYRIGDETIRVANGVDLSVASGDFVAIMGTSGSGKSTLLHIFGTLARPDSGKYLLNGIDALALNDQQQSLLRARSLGFVFQIFYLLPELTVWENIALPFQYQRLAGQLQQERITAAIERVRLPHRRNHRPSELSGGEMQRVAIARALVVNPLLILADEPTGNLDDKSTRDILDLFLELNASGTTFIMVTHDRQVASVAQRTLQMREGTLWEKPVNRITF
jgi:ABC-type lipoprotein export system ATPase subunit